MRNYINEILCGVIIVTAYVIVDVLTAYETCIFKPIMDRGFKLRGES